MKQNIKKNIAREFLFLIGSTIIFFTIIFLWIFLESRNGKKIGKLQNEIEKLENFEITNLKTFYYNENLNNLYDIINHHNLYHKSLTDFKLEMTSEPSQIELYKLVYSNKLYTKTQSEFLEKYFQTKKVPISKILLDYVTTANNPKYNADWNIINSKFPELKEFDQDILQEYVATANNADYNRDWKIINSKFPEFGFQKSNPNSLKKLNDCRTKLKKAKESFFYSSATEDGILGLGFLILSITFGLRYLIYATKWSLTQIKK